jgi:hydrogenase maturation factor HypE
MAVGVYNVHIYHGGKDIHERVLAVDDQDAFSFLDDKYKCRVQVITGGNCRGEAEQITPAAFNLVVDFKQMNTV